MSEKTTFICIGCPIGCPLQLEHVGDHIEEIIGHQCNRGAKYARQEFTDPRRELSTTMNIEDGLWERLPVKAIGPVKKHNIMEIVEIIHKKKVRAPVKIGDIVLETKYDNEILKVIATRSMPKKRDFS